MRAAGIPGPGLGSFSLSVEYADSAVRAVEVLEGDAFPGARLDWNIDGGQVHIAGFYPADQGPQGGFDLAVLRVQAAGDPGQCAGLSLTIRLLADAADAPLQAQAVDGRVCLTGE